MSDTSGGDCPVCGPLAAHMDPTWEDHILEFHPEQAKDAVHAHREEIISQLDRESNDRHRSTGRDR